MACKVIDPMKNRQWEPSMMKRSTVVFAVVFALMGCAPKKIPGTEIDDTTATRDILEVMKKYRVAFEREKTDAIVELADASFQDDGGSASPDDDCDYAGLSAHLNGLFERVKELRLDMNVRKVEFDDDETAARVTYNYTLSFRMPDLSQKTHSDSDIKQMTLKRVGPNDWKITSGI